jgi:signal peptidase
MTNEMREKISSRFRPSDTSYPFLIGHGLLLAFLVVLVVLLGAAVAPRALGYHLVKVAGGSMGDAAPVGSVVVLREGRAAEVETGDVILIREPGAPLPKIHRVIGLDRADGRIVARTKGDANPTPDPRPIVLNERVWMAVTVLPYLGYVVSVATDPLGWVLVIAIPGAILCFLVLRRIWGWGGQTPART